MQLHLAANAKVNLSLYITGKLTNGYHTLHTVMQSIDLHDVVTLTLTETPTITVLCSDPDLAGKENLAYTAATAFFEALGDSCHGVEINIEKHIPLSAGLGGGSADAAAVLYGLNQLLQFPFTTEQLTALALPLGADVPFCLVGGTCLATGVGEQLLPCTVSGRGWLVLTKPCQKESTAAMYRKYDEIKGLQVADTCDIIGKMERTTLDKLCQQLHNDFLPLYEQVEVVQAIDLMKQQYGAMGASLSGSGPTVFGVFANREQAQACAAQLEKIYGWSYVCSFAQTGVSVVN
ncbi:MAG: 4-(cytidine 5'-diphospho)-2-C-methyl-D-erythritol kinase [Clostridia bacterium]|nr:4-(cytidine 5'-diphospho)-2-C-methyl-D-erythritol kinase [Clostridia bacterium]